MPQFIKLSGTETVLSFPDEMGEEDIAKAISANIEDLAPTTSSLRPVLDLPPSPPKSWDEVSGRVLPQQNLFPLLSSENVGEIANTWQRTKEAAFKPNINVPPEAMSMFAGPVAPFLGPGQTEEFKKGLAGGVSSMSSIAGLATLPLLPMRIIGPILAAAMGTKSVAEGAGAISGGEPGKGLADIVLGAPMLAHGAKFPGQVKGIGEGFAPPEAGGLQRVGPTPRDVGPVIDIEATQVPQLRDVPKQLTDAPPPPAPTMSDLLQQVRDALAKGDENATRIRGDQGVLSTEGVQAKGSEAARSAGVEQQPGGEAGTGVQGVRQEGHGGIGVAAAQAKAAQAGAETGSGGPPEWILRGVEAIGKKLGFVSKAKVPGQQLRNRLENLTKTGDIPTAELQAAKEAGLEKYLTQPRSGEEVQKWWGENVGGVEVVKAGQGSLHPDQKAFLEFQHQWYDRQNNVMQTNLRDLADDKLTIQEFASKLGLSPNAPENVELLSNAQKYRDLFQKSKTTPYNPREAHWQSIAPKAESEMPGYVELAVVRPLTRKGIASTAYPTGDIPVEKFPSSHNFPPNTLGFVRGYMETKEGKKIFHVVEMQSDWAAKAREDKEWLAKQAKEQGISVEEYIRLGQRHEPSTARNYTALNEPLLHDWERLALKAAIQHAHAEGADAIALSDAPTAMMTEGHDRPLNMREPFTGETHPPQEKGMRLHYDTLGPRILEELTGKKGEVVEFGEHKMAFEMGMRGASRNETLNPRKDLIFSDPLGPGGKKVSVTARMYPLADAPKEFSLYGKDVAPKALKGGELSAKEKETKKEENVQKPGEVLGGMKVAEALRRAQEGGGETGAVDFGILRDIAKKMGLVKERVAPSEGSQLPDLMPKAEANRVFSQKFGIDAVPGFGLLAGGKRRFTSPQDEAVATWYVEKYGVSSSIASTLGEEIRGRVNSVFKADKKGNLNVEGRFPTQSKKTSDVFGELRIAPQAYKLSPEQRKVFNEIIKPILEQREVLIKKYALTELKGSYFPRIVTKLPREQKPSQGGFRVGSRRSLQKERAFVLEREGWEKRYRYEIDVEKILVNSTHQLYQAIADRRLSRDPALRGRTFKQVVADLKEFHAEEIGAGTMSEANIERMAEGLQARGTIWQPAFFGRIFDPEVAASLNKLFSKEQAAQSSVRRYVASGNSFLKALTLGFDLGAGQIQLLPTLYRNPGVWAYASYKSLQSLASPQPFAQYVRNNLPYVREFAQLGGSIGTLQEFASGLEQGAALTKVPIVGPVAAAFGRQFRTILDVAKIELYKAKRDTDNKLELFELAHAVETQLLSGRMEAGGVSHGRALLERVALLAPSYYRGAVNFVADLGRSGISGSNARWAMGAFIVGSVALYYGVGKILGMEDKEILKRLDPRNGTFMLWSVKEKGQTVNIGLGGVFRSFLRLFGKVVKTSMEHPENWKSLSSEKNPFSSWYRGHAGPVPSLSWDAFSGKDFLGRKSDLTSLPERTLPLPLQNFAEKRAGRPVPNTETVGSFFGASVFTETPTYRAKVEEMAQAKYGKPLAQLTLFERGRLEKQAKKETLQRSLDEIKEFTLRGIDAEEKRRGDLFSRLPQPSKDFLMRNKLTLPSYEPSIYIGRPGTGERVRLTQEESQRLEDLMVEKYTRFLAPLTLNKDFDKMSQEKKKEFLSRRLEVAKKQAETALRGEISRKQQGVPTAK